MAQISTSDFKTGMTLDLDDGLFTLVDFQHVKPGKGHAFVRTKLKNVRTGAVLERTLRAGEKMERAIVDKNEMSMLYRDGADFVFMDKAQHSSGLNLLDSVQRGDIPGVGMVMIDGIVRSGRSRNTPPATEIPSIVTPA